MIDTPDSTDAAEAASPALTRRDLLAGAVGTLGGAMLAGLPAVLGAQQAVAPAAPAVPTDATKLQGAPTSPLGERSPFETPKRGPTGATTGSSLTPLQDLTGNITPSDLHFERHHAGIPALDPERHTLTIHGLVERPLTFSVADIKRFPQVVRTHFVECSGNGRAAYRAPKPEMTAQQVAGMISTTEFTGVTLATLFRECGVKPEAKWFLAEGGDACVMTRSVPIEKAWDDALIVWAQNGEPLRPAQGYPLRLVLPGWEGNINIKWVRRLELGTQPWMTRWETSKYTDPLPNKTARRFTFECDVKSIITSPTVSDRVSAKGWHTVSGLAWSGRGRVQRVEVSVDGGTTWTDAQLLGEPQSKSTVRFQHMWEFSGRESVLLSRATDDAGYTQPTRAAVITARGLGTDYHFNQIVGWKVVGDGTVTFHGET
ncbi:sulfite dehydrogenase [Gemmatimonas phototrophica]|uniref:Molybdopterin-binding protein n=1 Tax=Gemmatimonas phototrophica TaxID=1379270 RepID=A0A143BH71_9BACT|nr:sulfite dehydrogenase [Gemmatimonas phototrophica]AMW03943.1 molybdopterin-binding protein [Gemmatimonas phototrophica]